MRTLSIYFLLAIVGLLGCQSSKTNNPGVLADSLGNSKASSNRNAFYKPFSEFRGDTLQYLKYNFVEHKDHYIGQPFSVLYHDLEIPVKSSVAGSDPNNGNALPTISLNSVDDETAHYRANSDAGPFYLVTVRWEKPVSAEAFFELYKASRGNWNPSFEALLAEEIIKDVSVMKYVNTKSKK